MCGWWSYASDFEPFRAFQSRINWFRTSKVGSQLKPKTNKYSTSFFGHYLTSFINDTSLITMVLVKTGGNVGWFVRF